jgi:hypothetical protein
MIEWITYQNVVSTLLLLGGAYYTYYINKIKDSIITAKDETIKGLKDVNNFRGVDEFRKKIDLMLENVREEHHRELRKMQEAHNEVIEKQEKAIAKSQKIINQLGIDREFLLKEHANLVLKFQEEQREQKEEHEKFLKAKEGELSMKMCGIMSRFYSELANLGEKKETIDSDDIVIWRAMGTVYDEFSKTPDTAIREVNNFRFFL